MESENTSKNLKLIYTLIDDCIEENDFREAFFIFIKFARSLDNINKDLLFNRYYKLLQCDK
jgi:hypothetical protein